MNPPATVPEEFNELPEPARAKAYQFFQELIKEGAPRSEAIDKARQMASNWVAERVPQA